MSSTAAKGYPKANPDGGQIEGITRLNEALDMLDADMVQMSADIVAGLEAYGNQFQAGLGLKADADHTHTTNDITNFAVEVDARIQALIGAAPASLDTLNELAAALGDDPNFSATITAELGNKLDVSQFTPANVLAKLKQADGAGSGLDAELLNGTALTQLTPFNSTSDFADGTIVETDIPASNAAMFMEIKGRGYGSSAAPYHIIIETYHYTGLWHTRKANVVSGHFPGQIKVFEINGKQAIWFERIGYWQSFSAVAYQMQSEDTTPKNRVIDIRNSGEPGNGVFFAPVITWNSDNDGSGSGLNADTVDGIHGNWLIRSDTDDSFDGKLTSSKATGTILAHAAYHDAFGYNPTRGTYIAGGSGGAARTLYASGILYDGTGFGTLWHSRNHGPNSGLRADLSALTNIPHSADLNNYVDAGTYMQPGDAQASTGSNYPANHAGILRVETQPGGGNGWVFQTYHCYLDDVIYTRRRYSGSWSAWNKQWSATNLDPVKRNVNANLAAGYESNALNLGNSSGQNFILSPSQHSRNFLRIANNGNFTITKDTSVMGDSYTLILLIENASSGAGAMTVSGFDKVTNDDFTTAANAKMFVQITSAFGVTKVTVEQV